MHENNIIAVKVGSDVMSSFDVECRVQVTSKAVSYPPLKWIILMDSILRNTAKTMGEQRMTMGEDENASKMNYF